MTGKRIYHDLVSYGYFGSSFIVVYGEMGGIIQRESGIILAGIYFVQFTMYLIGTIYTRPQPKR